jgi:hypothetical protein
MMMKAPQTTNPNLDALLRDHGGLTGLAGELGQFDPVKAETHGSDDNARPSIAPLVILAIVAAFFLWAFAPRAHAEINPTVQGLYDLCKAREESSEFLSCVAYIAGASDTLRLLANSPEMIGFAICGDATYGAMVQAYKNWAEKHPEYWSKNRLSGLIVALSQAWPCPAPKN